MNIKPGILAGVGGVEKGEFEIPDLNIRAGVALIRDIRDRIADPNPNTAQIGSIDNFAGRKALVSVRKVIESYESDVIQGRPWQIEDEADVDSRKPRLL